MSAFLRGCAFGAALFVAALAIAIGIQWLKQFGVLPSVGVIAGACVLVAGLVNWSANR